MFDNKLKRAILDGRFEETELGLFVPSTRTLVQGVFKYNKRGEPEEMSHNLVVTEGLNYIVGVALAAVTPITAWYVAIFSGDVVVAGTWTAANFTANSTELTAYTAASRPAWTPGAVASGAVNSFASKAEFVSTADAITVRGAALLSASAKSSVVGTLLGASRFTSAKALDTGEILDVGYGIELTPVV